MRPDPLDRGHAALRRGRASLIEHVYVVTAVTCHRVPWFSDEDVCRAAVDAFHGTRAPGDHELLAWVLMPDHVHWLIRLGSHEPLHSLVNHLKSGSSRGANRVLRRAGPLWACAFHDHAVRDESSLAAAAAYIITNPVRARIVSRVEDYRWWFSRWADTHGDADGRARD